MKKKTKDTDYFEYFRKSAEYAKKAAVLLDDIFRDYDKATFSEKRKKMHQLEHEADMNRHSMIEQLAKEFIPPIEREDIVALAQELDNVVDSIDDVVLRVYMFDIEKIPPEALKFTELVIRCTEALYDALAELRNFKKSQTLKNLLITVNNIESEGDALHSQSVHDLFKCGGDPLTIVSWMKIYDGCEDCLDACEDAVDIVESVVMKNS